MLNGKPPTAASFKAARRHGRRTRLLAESMTPLDLDIQELEDAIDACLREHPSASPAVARSFVTTRFCYEAAVHRACCFATPDLRDSGFGRRFLRDAIRWHHRLLRAEKSWREELDASRKKKSNEAFMLMKTQNRPFRPRAAAAAAHCPDTPS